MRAAVVLFAVPLAVAAWIAAPSRAADTYDATNIRLDRVVGVVEIQTGGVDQVSVDYLPGDADVDAPRFQVRSGTLEVSQLTRRDDVDCRRRDGRLSLRVERGGFHPVEDYGRYVIHAPEGAMVAVRGGAVTGQIGDVGALALEVHSCAGLTVGDVAGATEVEIDGSGDVTVGAIGGALSVAVNGSGRLVTGAAAGGLDAVINGSGDVELASLTGDVNAAIHGSGDVRIKGGQVGALDVTVMGSGQVRFDGVAQSVRLVAMGSGGVYVAEVTGTVDTRAMGSGRIHVGRD